MVKKLTAAALLFCSFSSIRAQTIENSGWLFLSNSKKLTEKIDILTDIQVRSADRFDYVNTLLIRGAFNYNFNKKHSFALGYAYKTDWSYENDVPGYAKENRIYEQYLYDFGMGKIELNIRLRLEQRFVKENAERKSSQRARAFVSAQIPLVTDSGFTKGLYTKIQNELFMNVQHKENINNRMFDQNRISGGIGFRFNKTMDLDVSYLYLYQKEAEKISKTNVWQVMLTTNL